MNKELPMYGEALHACLQRKERELRAVTEIVEMIGQALPLRVILDQIARQVAALIKCPFCALLLRHGNRSQLRIEGAFGLAPDYIAQINADGSLDADHVAGLPSTEVFRTGTTVMWQDLRDDPRFNRWRSAIEQQGYSAMIAVPMFVQHTIIGTLNCYHRDPYRFRDHEIALLNTIAGHAAIAIHNASLIERLNQSVSDLRELNNVIQHQNAILARSEAIHDRLTALVLEERGLTSIVEVLATLLDTAVALYNDQFERYATSDPAAPLLALERLPASLLNGIGEQHSTVYLAASPQLPAPTTLVPIGARGAILGYLALSGTAQPVDEMARHAIEHARTVCALELLKQRNAQEVERRLRGNFIGDLLNGWFVGDDEICERAARLGYNLHTPHRVLVVRVNTFGDYLRSRGLNEQQVADLKQCLTDSIDRALGRSYRCAVAVQQGDRAVVLVPCASADTAALADIVRVCRQLVTELQQSFKALAFSVGIGAPTARPAEFRRSHQEALDGLAVADKFGPQGSIVAFEELGIYRLLLRHSAPGELLDFAHRRLDPIIDYDAQRSGDLLLTLEVYLQHGQSPTRTAQALFCHTNTIKHRLHKIRELSGLETSDSQQMLEAQLALLIRRLAGNEYMRNL